MSSDPGRTTAIYFGTQVGSTVAGFAATWYITNVLGAAVYGRYSKVVALLFWLAIPASALGYSMNKRISEGTDRGAFLSAGLVVNLLVHLLLVGLILVFRDLVDLYIGGPVALPVAGLLVARAAFKTMLSALRGYKQVGASGAVKTLETVLRALLQISALLFLGAGLAGLVITHSIALAATAVVAAVVLQGKPKAVSGNQFRAIASFAKYSWIGTVKTRAFAYADIALMGVLGAAGLATVTDTQIGIYAVAWTVASVLALVSISIKQTLFPELSELGVEEDYERVQHFLNEGLVFAGVFAIPGLFGSLVVGDTLLTIFRPEFARGGTILAVLITARLFAAYGEQFINVVNAIDRPDVAFLINIAYVIANLGLNLVLIVNFGWYGAAAATTVSAGANLLIASYAQGRLIGAPDVPWRELGIQVVAGFAMFGVVYALDSLVSDTLAWAMVLVGIGAVVYMTLLLTLSARVRGKAQMLSPF